MNASKELRHHKKMLEQRVKSSVEKFIEDTGFYNIQVSVSTSTFEDESIDMQELSSVDVDVTIMV